MGKRVATHLRDDDIPTLLVKVVSVSVVLSLLLVLVVVAVVVVVVAGKKAAARGVDEDCVVDETFLVYCELASARD